MNVCYLDFWPGFDKDCNWFNLLFQGIFPNKQINFHSNVEEADVIFASSFGNERKNSRSSKAVKIFYTGENERPDLDFADYSLSFDFDTYGGRNFRLPHWYMYVNWWGVPNFPHARISVERLNRKWNPEEVYDRKNFCSIIIGNPVANRIEVAQKLNEYQPVNPFGRVFGNHYDGCKIDLMENFRWNICFENSITDGYVTEKLLEAKVAGCIPIYFGSESVEKDFNRNCFVDFTKMNNVDELYETVTSIDKNKDKFITIAKEPLFNEPPSLEKLNTFLKGVLREYV